MNKVLARTQKNLDDKPFVILIIKFKKSIFFGHFNKREIKRSEKIGRKTDNNFKELGKVGLGKQQKN